MHQPTSVQRNSGRNLPPRGTVKIKNLLLAGMLLSVSAFAQTNSQTVNVEHMTDTPIFRVTVISRRVTAVNYRHRSGSTRLDFAGTDLMPAANGDANVN